MLVTNTFVTLLKLKSGINTIVVSPRRYGKASLIKNLAFDNKDKKIIFVHIDIYNRIDSTT